MPVGRLVRAGLVGGIAVLFVALVGLMAKVADINLIGTQVTGAYALLALAPFTAGYVAVAAARRGRADRVVLDAD